MTNQDLRHRLFEGPIFAPVVWIFASFVCAHIVDPLASTSDDKPKWIQSRPLGAGFYIGIGSANMENFYTKEDAENAAFQNALREISSQVEIKVESGSYFSMTESTDESSSAYEEEMRTSVQMDLNDVEIVDTWKGKKRIWVYARLSKVKHRQRINASDARVKSELVALLNSYEELDPVFIAQRVGILLKAQSTISREKIVDPYIEIAGAQHNVESLFSSHLMSELSRLRITPVADSIALRTGSNLAKYVEFSVMQEVAGRIHPAPNIPVRFEFDPSSSGVFAGVEHSDAKGLAAGRITEIRGKDRRTVVTASIDALELLRGDSTFVSFSSSDNLAGLPPAASVLIESKPRVVFFEFSPEPGTEAPMKLLRAALKKSISGTGVMYEDRVGAGSTPELCGLVTLEITRISNTGNIVFAYLKPQIDISDCRTGDIQLTIGGENIKQGSRDVESASIRAVRKFIKSELGDIADKLFEISLPSG